jgi:hypothetical protein
VCCSSPGFFEGAISAVIADVLNTREEKKKKRKSQKLVRPIMSSTQKQQTQEDWRDEERE